MIALPPLPPWAELHPLVIHFPIVLLLIAPLFILIGALLRPERGRPFLYASLILMILGTVAIWVAVQTGEATADLVERNPRIVATLEKHEDLAEKSQVIFAAATVIFAAAVFAPRVFRRETARVFSTIVPLVFVAFYAIAALVLVNTAHQGGTLVHELGSSPAVGLPDAAAQPAAEADHD